MERKTRILGFFLAGLLLAAGSGCGVSSADTSKADNRAPAAPPSLKDERPKIIAFGDSLTAGFGLTEKESYPYLLQKKIEADGFNYEVINAGVSGDTSLGGLERFDWVLDQENVRILILELGANDLLRNVPVDEMKKNLDEIIARAKAKGVRVLFCGMVAPASVGDKYQKEFSKVFPDLADKHGVTFLPFILEDVALKRELNQADGIHPNAEGEKIMTDNVYRELKPMLSEKKQ